MIRHEVDKKKNQNMISDLSTLVIFKYFLEAFRDSFKVSRFLVFRFLETQKPPKTAGNRKLNVQIADVGWFLHRSVKKIMEVCETDRLNSLFEGI